MKNKFAFSSNKIKYKLYFDGACLPINPGGNIGYGFYVLDSNGVTILSNSYHEVSNENNTNNVAEYKALLEGLNSFLRYIDKEKIELKDYELGVFSDSMLVIKQCIGHWRIKEGFYVDVAKEVNEILNKMPSVFFQWIPRSENELADEFSRKSLIENGLCNED